ncbi:MAG: polysaccharide deacetylase family protein [Nitrosotalea sp.]
MKGSKFSQQRDKSFERFRYVMAGSLGTGIIIMIVLFVFHPLDVIEQYATQQSFSAMEAQICNTQPVSENNSKIVILTFDDSRKSQSQYAEPILQKCGFKATFFTVCNFIGQDSTRMTWDDIATLQSQGNDIESHTMNHYDLIHLSMADLDYEVGQSQKCLLEHHVNSTIFASPYGDGAGNKTIIDTVSKYYMLGREGYAPLMYLHCDEWKTFTHQTDCRTYSDDGQPNFASRYSIRAWDHNYYDIYFNHNDTRTFSEFVNEVNAEAKFNVNETRAIPVIVYHDVSFNENQYNTDPDLFSKEMNYLSQNGFKVITMADLGYDTKSNHLYVK